MSKKMFSSIMLVLSLMFFVSCQDNKDSSKGMKGKKAYQNKYQKDSNNTSPDRCPSKKCAPKKTCPRGCKEKCCLNQKSDKSISPQQEERIIQEHNKINATLDSKPDKIMPLEELKAAIESQNENFDITEAEIDEFDLEN